jgi:hypothetical protein
MDDVNVYFVCFILHSSISTIKFYVHIFIFILLQHANFKTFLFCIHSETLKLSQIHRCNEPHGDKCANDVDVRLAGTLDCMMTFAERCHWKENKETIFIEISVCEC